MENGIDNTNNQENNQSRHRVAMEDAILVLQAQEEMGLTKSDIARRIGYSPNGTVSGWVKDGVMPKRAAILVRQMLEEHRAKTVGITEARRASVAKAREALAVKRAAAAKPAAAPAAKAATSADSLWVLKHIEGDRVTTQTYYDKIGTMQIEGREYFLIPKAKA